MRTCEQCKENTVTGRKIYCDQCYIARRNESRKRWAIDNRDKRLVTNRLVSSRLRKEKKELYNERNRKYRAEHPEWWAEQIRKRDEKRNGKPRYDVRARKKRVVQAIPKCLSKEHRKQIIEIYKNRPEGFHVDHVIPLKSDTVSGLHVPWNLQYLPKAQNLSKGNRV
jgi:hypothetical protein